MGTLMISIICLALINEKGHKYLRLDGRSITTSSSEQWGVVIIDNVSFVSFIKKLKTNKLAHRLAYRCPYQSNSDN